MSAGGNDGSAAAPRLGRPYDHSRDAEILAITLDFLADQDYEHVTLDAVAQRAGRAKTTLYRRWPTKLDLVVAAVLAAGPPPELEHLPGTGSLRTDLLALVDSPWLGGPERRSAVVAGLTAAARTSRRLADVVRRTVTEPSVLVVERLLRRAFEQGEIPADLGHRLAVVAQVVPVMMNDRPSSTEGSVGRDHLVAVIDDVVLPAVGWQG